MKLGQSLARIGTCAADRLAKLGSRNWPLCATSRFENRFLWFNCSVQHRILAWRNLADYKHDSHHRAGIEPET